MRYFEFHDQPYNDPKHPFPKHSSEIQKGRSHPPYNGGKPLSLKGKVCASALDASGTREVHRARLSRACQGHWRDYFARRGKHDMSLWQ